MNTPSSKSSLLDQLDNFSPLRHSPFVTSQAYLRPGYEMSVLSRTDSMVSGIPGAGRTLDRLLSSAGRKLDPLLLRAAETLGNTPYAILYRIAAHSQAEHRRRNPRCNFQVFPNIQTLRENPRSAAQPIVDAGSTPCPSCGSLFHIAFGMLPPTEIDRLVAKLLKWTE